MFMQKGQSESMLRKSLFLWSSIRNRRVLPDGEVERDDTCHDDDDGHAVCDNDDDWMIMVSNHWLPWCLFIILMMLMVMIMRIRMKMEQVRVEWKCLDVVLWVCSLWLRVVVMGWLTLYHLSHDMITMSRNPICSFHNDKAVIWMAWFDNNNIITVYGKAFLGLTKARSSPPLSSSPWVASLKHEEDVCIRLYRSVYNCEIQPSMVEGGGIN